MKLVENKFKKQKGGEEKKRAEKALIASEKVYTDLPGVISKHVHPARCRRPK